MERDRFRRRPKPGLGSLGTEGDIIHETGRPLPWFRESTPGNRTGYESFEAETDGFSDIKVEGNALEERYVAPVRYCSLEQRRTVIRCCHRSREEYLPCVFPLVHIAAGRSCQVLEASLPFAL